MATAKPQKSPVALRGKQRRPFEERLAVRFPRLFQRLAAWLAPWVFRMPRHWRLRRLLVESAHWRGKFAFERRDLELLRVICHSHCIWDFTHAEGWLADQVYRGHEGTAAFLAEWEDAWGEGGWEVDLVSLAEFGGGVFITELRLRGVGRASGVAVEMDLFQVADLRDGLLWRAEFFSERAQAVAAANARSRSVQHGSPVA